MALYLTLAGLFLAILGSLLFSSLTYSLRDMSRTRLAVQLEKRRLQRWLEPTLDHAEELVFLTAVARLFFNTVILITVLLLLDNVIARSWVHYMLAVIITGLLAMVCSVAVPNAVARYAGEAMVAAAVRPLNLLRSGFWPVSTVMHGTDAMFRRATGSNDEVEPEQIEQDILSAVEEGEKEGVVDEDEREMIESVIEFRDTHVAQVMTARPDIVGLEVGALLTEVKKVVEESGHSRIPVYDGTLDHVVGVLYARDLIKHLGLPPEQFDMRSAMRPAFYVPETKPLRHLLQDFRLQKVHIAIVLDEYGGTAGLVSIEDILEELVGEISDEHEPIEPAAIKRIDDADWEADARVHIDELNRVVGLNLPEEAGYDTLGGYISTTLGRIPEAGVSFEGPGVKLTILNAEPQRVNRVKLHLTLQSADADRAG